MARVAALIPLRISPRTLLRNNPENSQSRELACSGASVRGVTVELRSRLSPVQIRFSMKAHTLRNNAGIH